MKILLFLAFIGIILGAISVFFKTRSYERKISNYQDTIDESKRLNDAFGKLLDDINQQLSVNLITIDNYKEYRSASYSQNKTVKQSNPMEYEYYENLILNQKKKDSNPSSKHSDPSNKIKKPGIENYSRLDSYYNSHKKHYGSQESESCFG